MQNHRIGVGDQHLRLLPSRKAVPKEPLAAGNLMKLTEGLAAKYPDRRFATEQGRKSAEWVATQMKAAGLKPPDGESYFQKFTWDVEGENWPGQNVVGLLEGSDPKLKDEYIIVAAHHDSAEGTKQGANDNATGCAAVLAIAQEMAKNPPKRSVLFVTFDGEEGATYKDKYQWGRRGSKTYAKKPVVPLEKTALLLNMDMLGQVHLESGKRTDIHQWASGDAFAQQVLQNGSDATIKKGETAIEGYPEQPAEMQFFTTDAMPIYQLGVPTVNFLSGRDLDNHSLLDEMPHVIPERMEQYAVLAHACALEAANHPESLEKMGIKPGGMMPTYPLIQTRSGAGTRIDEEELLRLEDLKARMPELKSLARDLVTKMRTKAIEKRAGVTFAELRGKERTYFSEPVLNNVREKRAALVDQLHDIPKQDADGRKGLMDQIDALGGIEDILAGAIYVKKITNMGGYYLQRIPERLADMLRGAQRLSLEARMEGIVSESDVKAFTPHVSADRAVSMARDSAASLMKAFEQTAFALIDSKKAAEDTRGVLKEDLDLLNRQLSQTADQIAGDIGVDKKAVAEVTASSSILDFQLSGLKGSPSKWLKNYAQQNALTDFALNYENTMGGGALLEQVQALEQAVEQGSENLAQCMLDFYRPLAEIAFGKSEPIETIEDLMKLSAPHEIQKRSGRYLKSMKKESAEKKLEAAAADPAVRRLQDLRNVVVATFELSGMLNKDGKIEKQHSLHTVKERIDTVIETVEALQGSEAVAQELSFWSEWLAPFTGLETLAQKEGKNRSTVAQAGMREVDKLWPQLKATIDPGLNLSDKHLLSLKSAAKEIRERLENAEKEGRRDIRAEAAFKKLSPAIFAADACRKLLDAPSPLAETDFQEAVRALQNHLGDPAVESLTDIAKQLARLHALDDVHLGREKRSGPLGVLAVRAAQKEG